MRFTIPLLKVLIMASLLIPRSARGIAATSSIVVCSGRRAVMEKDRGAELKGLLSSGWQLDGSRDAIKKTFEFKNFIDAFGFMTQAAIVAEGMNHHPEWFNVYSRVDVVLSSHDCGGLSLLDVCLASKMDELALKYRYL